MSTYTPSDGSWKFSYPIYKEDGTRPLHESVQTNTYALYAIAERLEHLALLFQRAQEKK